MSGHFNTPSGLRSGAYIAVLSLSLGSASATEATELNERWEAVVSTETRYFSWRGLRGTPAGANDNPGRGTQIYMPVAVQFGGRPHEDFRVEITGRGGVVHSRQSTTGLSGEVNTITDTVASGTVTYLGFTGIQPFVSLNGNIPTGKSALFGPAAHARMDPDLVDISSFGEGWNIGPTIGFTVPVTPTLMFTLSGGFTWRGIFDRESDVSVAHLDPGDVFTATASVSHSSGPWSSSLVVSVSEETNTTDGANPLYRAGRRYLGNASLSYDWRDKWGVTSVTASLSQSARNEVLFSGVSDLVTEPMNANSKVYRVGMQHLVPFGDLKIGPTASYLQRAANSYDPLTFQFVPAKERFTAGMTANYVASESVSLNARVEHVWTYEDEMGVEDGRQFSVLANGFVLGSAVPMVSSQAWQIAGGVNVKF